MLFLYSKGFYVKIVDRINYRVSDDYRFNDMNAIGFNNFRRFLEFPDLEFGGINLMIGSNNSGKSTIVKALLLMRDFLTQKIQKKSENSGLIIPEFRFDSSFIHIGSFNRAFCNKCAAGQNIMSFATEIDHFRFEVEIKGDRVKDTVPPFVTKLSIKDNKRNILLEFDFSLLLMKASFFNDNLEDKTHDDKDSFIQEKKLLEEELKKVKSDVSKLNDIVRINDEILRIDAKLKTFNNIDDHNELSASFTIVPSETVPGRLMFPELVRLFCKYSTGGKISEFAPLVKNTEDNKVILYGKSQIINDMANELEILLYSEQIEYIYAHSASQQVLYQIKDSNDFLSKTVHDFFMSRISEDDDEYKFVKEWMAKFNIGISFNIDTIAGEAYQVSIMGFDGNVVQLADEGMGTIQMMILLFRLATLIRRYHGYQTHVIILIEEPEQNLHPAYQSLLADLFFEVNSNYGYRFIIETHSEYIVRKSQVIVATKFAEDLENNPFRTYYMPKDRIPYKMIYTCSGRFENNFDEGFFDEAGKSNLILLKKERGMI